MQLLQRIPQLLGAGTVLAMQHRLPKSTAQESKAWVFFCFFFCAFLLIPNSPYTLACKQAPGGMVWPRLEEPRRELSGSSFFPLRLRPILNLRACSQAIVHGQARNQVMH